MTGALDDLTDETTPRLSDHGGMGILVNGRYALQLPIGSGPNGEVFEAVDVTTRRTVAIKILRPGVVPLSETRPRLVHPNLVDAFDVAELEGGRTYLAMELVRGADGITLVESGPIPAVQALKIVRKVLQGLQHAHRAGIAHLRIKPSNLKIEADGTVRVLDIAMARVFGPADSGGPATDFHAVGALLQQMLGATVPSVSELEFLLWRATQPDPRDRFRDAADIILGVENALRSLQR